MPTQAAKLFKNIESLVTTVSAIELVHLRLVRWWRLPLWKFWDHEALHRGIMEPHDAQRDSIFYTAKDRRLCVTSGKCSLIDLTKWFWVCRQTGVFGGLLYTGIIWLVEVGALLLLIRTAEKYKTKSYQVFLPFPSSPWLMELRKCDTFAGIISMEFCELKE